MKTFFFERRPCGFERILSLPEKGRNGRAAELKADLLRFSHDLSPFHLVRTRIYSSSAPGGTQLQYPPRPQHLHSDNISGFHMTEPALNLLIAALADLNSNHLEDDVSSKKHLVQTDLRLDLTGLDPQARSRGIVRHLLDEKSHRLGKIESRSQFIFEHDSIKAKPERRLLQ